MSNSISASGGTGANDRAVIRHCGTERFNSRGASLLFARRMMDIGYGAIWRCKNENEYIVRLYAESYV